MADVEASLIKGSAKHLATARQESIVLEKLELDDFLLEAEAVDRDTIRIRVDGKDLSKAGELLAALTKGFPRVR